MVDRTQTRSGIGHRQPHAVTHAGVAGMQSRQPGPGVEAVHRLHQIEHRVAEHVGVVAHLDQCGVRYVGSGQSAQHAGLAQDHRVADRAQVARSATKHVLASRPGEPQHDVLGSAGDLSDALDRTLTQTLLRHPGGDLRCVVGQVLHGAEVTSRRNVVDFRPRQSAVEGAEDAPPHQGAQRNGDDRRRSLPHAGHVRVAPGGGLADRHEAQRPGNQ